MDIKTKEIRIAIKSGYLDKSFRNGLSPSKILNSLSSRVSKIAGNTSGNCGGHGVSGTLRAMDIWKFFSAVDIEGRIFLDAGGGNGQMILAAKLCKCKHAWAWELPENEGCFHIYKAVAKSLEEDDRFILHKIFLECKDGLAGALQATDIEKVSNFRWLFYIACT